MAINNYFSSTQVKIYPSAYRGFNNNNTPYDAESRLQTEKNLTAGVTNWKESYIISFTKSSEANKAVLKCVIGGYYFEINNLKDDLSDFVDSTEIYKLYIHTGKIPEATVVDSPILFSWDESTNLVLDNTDGKFTGIKLATSKSTVTTGTISELAIVSEISGGKNILNYSAFLPNISSGSGYTTDANNDTIASSVHTYSNTASGEKSFAIGNDTKATKIGSFSSGYTTTAEGQYSHSEGDSTNAKGDHSHAEGISSTASGEGAHAEGNNTTASGDYSHAEGNNTNTNEKTGAHTSGNNTIASRNYQTVIGEYNTDNTDALFIIGNGHAKSGTETEDTKSNVVEVTQDTARLNEVQLNTTVANGPKIIYNTTTKSIDFRF